jgi:hypothetical protein
MTSKALGYVVASFALIVGADTRDARASTITFDDLRRSHKPPFPTGMAA